MQNVVDVDANCTERERAVRVTISYSDSLAIPIQSLLLYYVLLRIEEQLYVTELTIPMGVTVTAGYCTGV